MSLRIRRGTEAQRPSAAFDLGEIVWTTDTNKLYVGDGVNLGGKNILATSAGTGLIWNTVTQRLDFNGSGTGIVSVQADTNPSLGGNLNLNSRNITGTGSITISGTLSVTGLGSNLNLNTRNITGSGNINTTGTATFTGNLTSSNVTTTGSQTNIFNGPSIFSLNGADNKIVTIGPQTTGQPSLEIIQIMPFTQGVAFSGMRGTLASPQISQVGDGLGSVQFRVKYTTTPVAPSDGFAGVAGIVGNVTDMGNGSTISPSGKLQFMLVNPITPNDFATVYLSEFTAPGVWTAPGFISKSKISQAGIGYGTGAGSTAVQSTSRTTSVTINAPCGTITLFNTTTTIGQITTFTVNNTIVDPTDVVTVSVKTATGMHMASVTNTAMDSFTVSVYTPAAVVVAEAPVLNFVVIKSVAA
jgi:Major tropism determinant N-terminal domain